MKFLDPKAQDKVIRKKIDAAIRRVLDKGEFIGGSEVKDLENQVAKFCGVRFAVAVNSGTDALFLSLKALGIKKGDEVITAPFTFIATAEVIANTGATPIFVDVDSKTFNIDASKIEEKLTNKTKAIIPVHLFGQMADMANINKIAKKHKLFVIEDSAQAIGAEQKNKKSGSLGDLGCFSFFPSKNLGAYGDGGMVVTNNKKLAEKIKVLRSHGSSPKEKYFNIALGFNSRLDAIQASILLAKISYLKKWNTERNKVAEQYGKLFGKINQIELPVVKEGNFSVFNQFAIRVKNRNDLKKYLEKHEVETKIYYPLPLHLQPAFRYLSLKKGDFPESEKASKEILCLPIYPGLSTKDQQYISGLIKKFYE